MALVKIIYPNDPKKYSGWIHHGTNYKSYVVKFTYSDYREKFDNFEDAENFRRDFAIESNKVKNIIYEYEDRCEVELTQGKRAIFDKEDIPIVEMYTWHARDCSGEHYAITTNKGCDQFRMHNLVMNFTPDGVLSVDHINKNPLDNRKANLRIVDWTTQVINRNIQKNNTSGTIGVSRDVNPRKEPYWAALWYENGKMQKKRFSVKKYGDDGAKELAITFRKQKERELPQYINALHAE